MRERANCHLSIAADMRAAISVFDHCLINYKEPNDDERRGSSGKNAAMHHELCHSERNRHSYGDNPTKKEAMQNELDLIWPQLNPCLWSLLNLPKHPFPLTAITSQIIQLDSIQGLIELLGSSKVAKLGLVNPIQLNMKYDRCNEIVTAFEVKQTIVTLKSLWGNHQLSVLKATSGRDVEN
ncbi:hypothetical protein ACHAWO_011549 [Cyclotella atomus]|uniref:Uncharacterized protein n=1 Tax=Cyclotella atomus TaxID=382360 RepID=A0ABD3N0I4_9STRA